ncbi:hypothetical protein B5807_03604 [Epicoccum nigrum]|uniref:BTB domain-containing protein n=1 Tax=Epicoccum nigrum TaxID=105696 RepID=A0A1Y2M5T9_EPING|nr:hypothetical protein B5807_03604 [Epicoccum nigrum]
MAPTVHVIDPDYDTVIVLKDPSTEFGGEYVLRPPGSGGATENHYQVSSRHLQLASPWFKRTMAAATWAESKLENGKYQTKQVPRVINLELLAKVDVLVDYYECGEAIEMFTAMWINEVKKTAIPSVYCRDLVLWI